MTAFIVTEKAMRPASDRRECFYCLEPVGAEHKADCVLVSRLVRVRVEMEIEVEVPAHWDDEQINFHYNDGSWCSSGIAVLIKAYSERKKADGKGCLCNDVEVEYLSDVGESFLRE